MRYLKAITHTICFFSLLCLLGIPTLFITGTGIAEDVIQPSPLDLKATTQPASGEYIYEMEGRADPFVPFISPKSVSSGPQVDPNEIIEENKILSGMQLFEPGQLALTAILMTSGEAMAMVQDVTGKGYILREGMLIGRRGVVTKIDPAAVIITETAKTRAGKEIFNTITMKLNKEGDE